MDSTYNIISLIYTLGFVQGVVLGILLIILNRKRDISTIFLGIFVLAYALELLLPIIKYSNIISNYPQLQLFPFDFRYLTFPLFYIYVQKISILPKTKNIYYILIPGAIALIINTIIFFQDIDTKEIIRNSIWFQTFDFIGLMFSLFIGIITYLFIKKHSTESKNQYVFTQNKELLWAKQFLLIGITYTIIAFSLNIDDFYFNLSTSIINVGLLYWISIHGVRQRNVQTLIEVSNTNIKNTNKRSNIQVKQNKEVDIELFKKIEEYIISEKIYTKTNLTIIDVSTSVNEHPKRVSHVINSISNKNFKSYINSFKINDAKKLLRDNDSHNLSIEGIGIEVGFQSKSVFYDAFKKETGITPSSYKNQN
ncbi:hypothetical protein BFR04_01515 [Gaetbulibacter sp. 4G1]|nr:AraC family transcriptional regulator [Gaetbulibacter sp. 4G1]PIA79548.1 hypothetical protein BFR04_01515 [Gaetbulibacter sp. 4G1]